MPHIWNACNTRFYFAMYLVRNICCTGYPVFQHVTEVAAPLAPTEEFEVVPPENSLHFLLILIIFFPFCWSVVRPAQDLNFDIDVKLSRGLIKNIHRVQQKWNRNKGNPVQFPNCWCAFVAFLFAHFLFLRISALCCCPTIAECLDLGTNELSTGA